MSSTSYVIRMLGEEGEEIDQFFGEKGWSSDPYIAYKFPSLKDAEKHIDEAVAAYNNGGDQKRLEMGFGITANDVEIVRYPENNFGFN